MIDRRGLCMSDKLGVTLTYSNPISNQSEHANSVTSDRLVQKY